MLNEVKIKFRPLFFIGFLFIILPFINFTATIDPETLPRCIALSILLLFYLIYYFSNIRKLNIDPFSFLKNPIVIAFCLYAVVAALSLTMALNPGDGVLDVLRIYLYL